MATSARRRRKRPHAEPAVADASWMPSELGARVAEGALAVVLLATNLLVDPSADAAFDAPKRLIAIAGTALAAAALIALPENDRLARRWADLRAPQKVSLGLLLAAIGGGLLATALSPRAAVALHGLRTVLLMGLLLPLGASRALATRRGSVLLGVFLGACAVNALASSLQRLQWIELFAIESVAGRSSAGGFIGNEGSLALVLALGAVAVLALILQVRTRATRLGLAALLALLIVGLGANATLTALLAFFAGALVVAVATLGPRALAGVAALAALGSLLAFAYPPLRGRAVELERQVRAGDWDAVSTYRFGPWAAALEMARERPIVGFGPGTFAAEFVPHRLRAEMRYQRRFLIPRETSTYGEAHCEVLQAFADAGIPAGLAALAATAILLGGLAARLRSSSDDTGTETVVVLGLCATGAVGALTWFPLQHPASAAPLLLALGRGWSLLGAGEVAAPSPRGVASQAPDEPPAAWRGPLRWLLALLLLLLAWPPEIMRYSAERVLLRTSVDVKSLLASGAARSPGASRALETIAAQAEGVSHALPGDSRPLVDAAAADLVAGRPDRALAAYRRALELGERAEIDLNVGRAFALQDRRPEAFAAFVRTAWISPALITSMPEAARPLVEGETDRLARALAEGRLAAPPALPPLDAPGTAPATPAGESR